mmetsp:Transcript_96052/g.248863  ORF Transcript_96052/g.248863 Transcript_96052/m.248863 type:complete len:272 (-) Transcript_96052:159-974(-)
MVDRSSPRLPTGILWVLSPQMLRQRRQKATVHGDGAQGRQGGHQLLGLLGELSQRVLVGGGPRQRQRDIRCGTCEAKPLHRSYQPWAARYAERCQECGHAFRVHAWLVHRLQTLSGSGLPLASCLLSLGGSCRSSGVDVDSLLEVSQRFDALPLQGVEQLLRAPFAVAGSNVGTSSSSKGPARKGRSHPRWKCCQAQPGLHDLFCIGETPMPVHPNSAAILLHELTIGSRHISEEDSAHGHEVEALGATRRVQNQDSKALTSDVRDVVELR